MDTMTEPHTHVTHPEIVEAGRPHLGETVGALARDQRPSIDEFKTVTKSL